MSWEIGIISTISIICCSDSTYINYIAESLSPHKDSTSRAQKQILFGYAEVQSVQTTINRRKDSDYPRIFSTSSNFFHSRYIAPPAISPTPSPSAMSIGKWHARYIPDYHISSVAKTMNAVYQRLRIAHADSTAIDATVAA